MDLKKKSQFIKESLHLIWVRQAQKFCSPCFDNCGGNVVDCRSTSIIIAKIDQGWYWLLSHCCTLLTYERFSLPLIWSSRLKTPAGQLLGTLAHGWFSWKPVKGNKRNSECSCGPCILDLCLHNFALLGHGFTVNHKNELWGEEFCFWVRHIILIKRLQKARMTSHFYFLQIILWLKINFRKT